MDRKTLEYMEERAKQARLIVNAIEALKTNIEKVERVKQVHFRNVHGDRLFDSSIGTLTNEMKEFYIKMAEQEIEYLEQKLAEL